MQRIQYFIFQEVIYKVVHGFKIVKRWLDSFKLSLNLTKTYYIVISLNSTSRPVYDFIKIDNHNNIKAVSNVKYSRIVIDENQNMLIVQQKEYLI